MFFPLILISSFGYVALDALHFRMRDKRWYARAPLSVFQIVFALFGFWYMRPVLQAFASQHIIIALIIAAAIAWLVRRAKGYTRAARFWLAMRWFFIFGIPTAAIWFVTFYETWDNCARVARDPRVRPLFSTCNQDLEADLKKNFPRHNWDEIMRELQPRSVFLSTTPGLAYIGTGNEEEKEPVQILALVERRTGRVRRVDRMPAVFRGTCDAATGLCAMSISGTEEVRVFDDKTGQMKKIIKTPARPRFHLAPPHSRTLFIGFDHDPIVAAFDFDKLAITRYKYKSAAYHGVGMPCLGDARDQGMTFMAYNSRSRKLDYMPECPLFNTLLIRTDENLKNIKHYNIGWIHHLVSMGYIMGIEIDPALNELYLSATLDGAVYAYDYDTMRLKKKIRVGVGMRETTYDPHRHLLFVGHYVNGYLYVIDMRQGEVIDRIFIGKRNRQILYDPETKRVLVTSANGFFDVDVSKY